MADNQDVEDNNKSKSGKDEMYLPIDPSNTSDIGQKVETPIVKRDEGISEQSAKWEDVQERGMPEETILKEEADRNIKSTSHEEIAHDKNGDQETEAF